MSNHTGWFLPDPRDEDEAISILSRHEELSNIIRSYAEQLRNHSLSATNIIDGLEAEGFIGVVREVYATDSEAEAFEFEKRMHDSKDSNRQS